MKLGIKERYEKADKKQLWILIGIVILIILFWSTKALYPLKMFTVLLHETSHGLAAMLTGGRFHQIELSGQQGGLATTSGGWRFLVLSAGYLGSMLFGGLILRLSAKAERDKTVMKVIGFVVIGIGVLLVRPIIGFGFLFTELFGATLVLLGFFAPNWANDSVLKVIGLTSMLYAIIDIKSDILDRTVHTSDAYRLFELTGIPSVIWGVIWITLAVFLSTLFLLKSAESKEKLYG